MPGKSYPENPRSNHGYGVLVHPLWFDIDLEAVPAYKPWKPESVEWAMGVDWAMVNDLVRHSPGQFLPFDFNAAICAAQAAGVTGSDLEGLLSLYDEPVYATSSQITSGGHRIIAMRRRGIRWALGLCCSDDVGDGTGGTISESRVYFP